VIQSLDGPPLAVAQIKVFTIINSDANTLRTMLEQVFATTTAGTGPTVRLEGGTESSGLIPVRFSVDLRTNSIVAIGSAEMLAMVEAVLLTLDEPEMHNRRMMVYRLLNTPAATIATTLQTFLTNERQLRQQSNVMTGEMDVFGAEVIIQAENETNSLLVSTTPNRFEQLRRMIQVLDEPPAMVQIKVVIAEVDISNTNELGFELGLQDSVLFDRSVLNSGDFTSRTVSTMAPNGQMVQTQEIMSESRTPGFNFNNTVQGLGNNNAGNSQSVGTQGISNFALGRQNGELGYGGFIFSASSESVSVLIRALEESRRLTVLNNPTLYAHHNQESSLSVGQLVPTISNVNIDINGRQTNTIEDKEVGILLRVTPRIALNDSVTMNIVATKSSMESEASGTPIFVQDGVTVRAARTNNAAITTTIRTQSGEVAVLGGLNSQEEQMIHRAVPVISKIPLIGQLFQHNYKFCSRKELIFVFTPQVFRTQDEAFAVNQLAIARMHVCGQSMANMLDTTSVKTRMSDFTSSETYIERGQAIMLNESDFPSEQRMIEDSVQQDRMLPQPNKAPIPSLR
jgi:type II secretory pathway component GspD/PulD (secretin)